MGYSRQMSADEEGTVARLKTLRREIFDPKTAQFGGRIFKNTGAGAGAGISLGDVIVEGDDLYGNGVDYSQLSQSAPPTSSLERSLAVRGLWRRIHDEIK